MVNEGDEVTLRVIKVDAERRRIGLSLRKVDSPAYADLDWKMALSGEVEESSHAEVEPAEVEPVAEEPIEVEPVAEEPIEAEPVAEEPIEAEPTEAEPTETE